MRCLSCGFENPTGMKFCGQYATPLTGSCPPCGVANPPGFAYCGPCATLLIATPSMAVPSPQTYTPVHLAEKILTSNTALEGEGTPVTVVIVNASEATRRSARLSTLDRVRQGSAASPDRERRWTEHNP
jgi:hypothetical protein